MKPQRAEGESQGRQMSVFVEEVGEVEGSTLNVERVAWADEEWIVDVSAPPEFELEHPISVQGWCA
jgi:hypothetical protein